MTQKPDHATDSGQQQMATTPSTGSGGVMCFTPGVRIATARGLIPVEHVQPGDMLQTADNGLQAVIWVGQRVVSYQDLIARPELSPIHIAPGSVLGNSERLIVSPQHRFLLRRNLLGDLFQTREAFLRAKLLPAVAGRKARCIRPKGSVTYIHLMTARHEVIFAEGIATETFFPGPQGWAALHPDARAEISTLFPDLLPGVQGSLRLARTELRRKDLPAIKGLGQ